MPEFTVTCRIAAPVARVWEVLDDFGDIQRWSPGIVRSYLTSEGPVGEGTTRHCEFKVGTVEERIDRYEPQRRMTIALFEPRRLPITGAVADFILEPADGGTDVTLHYSYTPNLAGRLLRGPLDAQMRKGMDGLADGLQRACEEIAAGGA